MTEAVRRALSPLFWTHGDGLDLSVGGTRDGPLLYDVEDSAKSCDQGDLPSLLQRTG